MSATDLLSRLRCLGVVLEPNGERLRVDAPRGVITGELLEELTANKVEILNMLQGAAGLHYALCDKAVLVEPVEEPCFVGCGLPVRFYWQDGTGYGYCTRCDVHQRIETREM